MIKKKNDKEQWFIYHANLRTKTLVIIALSAIIMPWIKGRCGIMLANFEKRHFADGEKVAEDRNDGNADAE